MSAGSSPSGYGAKTSCNFFCYFGQGYKKAIGATYIKVVSNDAPIRREF